MSNNSCLPSVPARASCTIVQPSPHLPPIVGPRAELHGTLLLVEREPGDVDLTGGLEDARRHVQTAAVVLHHDVCGVRAVEFVIGTGNRRWVSATVHKISTFARIS